MKSVLILERSEVVLLLQVLLSSQEEYDSEASSRALDMVTSKLDMGYRPIRTIQFQNTNSRF